MTSTRKMVQEAVDAYFSGKLTVSEAFDKAYGPDNRRTSHPTRTGSVQTQKRSTNHQGKTAKK